MKTYYFFIVLFVHKITRTQLTNISQLSTTTVQSYRHTTISNSDYTTNDEPTTMTMENESLPVNSLYDDYDENQIQYQNNSLMLMWMDAAAENDDDRLLNAFADDADYMNSSTSTSVANETIDENSFKSTTNEMKNDHQLGGEVKKLKDDTKATTSPLLSTTTIRDQQPTPTPPPSPNAIVALPKESPLVEVDNKTNRIEMMTTKKTPSSLSSSLSSPKKTAIHFYESNSTITIVNTTTSTMAPSEIKIDHIMMDESKHLDDFGVSAAESESFSVGDGTTINNAEGGDGIVNMLANVSDTSAWPVKHSAIVEGDVILGGLMMVHSREDTITCGPIMPQGGIQALEVMLFTLDRINNIGLLPNISLGAHILDDCDKDTYGLEMAVDFIKGRSRTTYSMK